METTAIRTNTNLRTKLREILRTEGITGLIMYDRLLGSMFEGYARDRAIDIRVKLGIFRKPSMLTLQDCDRIMDELAV